MLLNFKQVRLCRACFLYLSLIHIFFNNHNRLLTETDYCISGKTGFTTKAGYCYVAAVEKDGRRMCLSLLGLSLIHISATMRILIHFLRLQRLLRKIRL